MLPVVTQILIRSDVATLPPTTQLTINPLSISLLVFINRPQQSAVFYRKLCTHHACICVSVLSAVDSISVVYLGLLWLHRSSVTVQTSVDGEKCLKGCHPLVNNKLMARLPTAVCVCVHVCVYVHASACVCVCLSVCVRVCVCVLVDVHVLSHTRMHVHFRVYLFTMSVSLRIRCNPTTSTYTIGLPQI